MDSQILGLAQCRQKIGTDYILMNKNRIHFYVAVGKK